MYTFVRAPFHFTANSALLTNKAQPAELLGLAGYLHLPLSNTEEEQDFFVLGMLAQRLRITRRSGYPLKCFPRERPLW